MQRQIRAQRIGGGQADVFGHVRLGNESRLRGQGDNQEDKADCDQPIDGRRLHRRIDEDAQDLWVGELETDRGQHQTGQHQCADPLWA